MSDSSPSVATRVAFRKHGLQNERHGPGDLRVGVRLHPGGHRCGQVRPPLPPPPRIITVNRESLSFIWPLTWQRAALAPPNDSISSDRWRGSFSEAACACEPSSEDLITSLYTPQSILPSSYPQCRDHTLHPVPSSSFSL